MKGQTFGAELELGNVDTKIKLPKCAEWDYRDYSIANSNGTANDPKKELNRYGSEIHTKPASSPEALVEMIERVYKTFPRFTVNFTTSLHVHIHTPGLRDNLKKLKRVARYIHEFQEDMYYRVDPIPIPERNEFESRDAFEGAWGWYKHRKRSHQARVSPAVYSNLIHAKTPVQFYLSHAPVNIKCEPQWQLVQRAGINLAHLWKATDTIEFRFFTMSYNLDLTLNAIRFCKYFLRAALNDLEEGPGDIINSYKLKFQEFHPYNYDMEQIWKLTNVHINGRRKAAENYAHLLNRGIIKHRDVN